MLHFYIHVKIISTCILRSNKILIIFSSHTAVIETHVLAEFLIYNAEHKYIQQHFSAHTQDTLI